MVKFFTSLLISIFLLLLVPQVANAAYLDTVGPDTTEIYKQALEAPGMNLPQFSLSSLDYMIMGLTKKLVGYPLLEGETINGSLQSSLSRAVGFLYTGQPSAVECLAYSANKLNLVKPTYAANSGAEFISPVLHIWTIARNTAYIFFVVIFVALGFMIMFRGKLNPQTAISVQLALPKIIIALIMVTFSYAISGFIVDTVFFGHSLIKNVMTRTAVKSPIVCDDPNNSGRVQRVLFGDHDADIRWEQNCDLGQYTPSAWPFDVLNNYGGGGVISDMAKGFGGFVFGAITLGTVANPIEGLFILVIAFSVVGATFKIFFTLLTKYIMIILLVITMPFSFLASALSAQSSPLKPLKGLLANTIAFPVTSALLALAYYFSAPNNANAIGDLPPFYTRFFETAVTSTPGKVGSVTEGLIAIGILMSIPNILSAIDQALESKPIAQGAAEQLSATARKIPIIGGMMG